MKKNTQKKLQLKFSFDERKDICGLQLNKEIKIISFTQNTIKKEKEKEFLLKKYILNKTKSF